MNEVYIPAFHVEFPTIYELSHVPHSMPEVSLENITFIFHIYVISP
jgi:hypothetical protein